MAGEELIKTIWHEALSFKLPAIKQTEKYKLNKSEDMDKVLEIDIEKTYKARDLINLLRAATMSNYIEGAYFIEKEIGKKVFMNLKLELKNQ